MQRTDAAHIWRGMRRRRERAGRVFEDPSAGAGNDGNFVSLDREAAKVAANQVRYDVVSAIVLGRAARSSHTPPADGRGS